MGHIDTDPDTGRTGPPVLQAAPTRRSVLRAVAAGTVAATALAGCDSFTDDPRPAPPPDPLLPVLTEALSLAARYDRMIVARPELTDRLTPLAQAHRSHAAELSQVIGAGAPTAPTTSTASAEPPPSDAAAELKALRRAEQRAQQTAANRCLRGPAAQAALVGSIAAARAGHAEALR